ncbi:hypothetical protein V6N13_017875 [Hibiscus sabdariffa]|uniref:Uncharacterized protein n=1 Tax=Hibiscus sabdariffa TaxID=183260 RepID=A0ABR2CH49_9ROSI
MGHITIPRFVASRQYMDQLEHVDRHMINKYADQNRPVSCLINNPFIAWASDVAESLGIPSAMLWVTAILGQFKKLDKPFCVLMDTFEELEPDIVEYMSKFCPIKIVGPLFKYPQVSNDMEQVDEIAHALLATGVTFLWMMRPPRQGLGRELHSLPQGFLEKVGDNGKIVRWSPQDKVLTHPSVSCFVSHRGWNSTMEALACGVPIVAFPQWCDQVTNAVYLVDVFKTEVRMCRGQAENRIVPREEVVKCFLEATTGPKASELKSNALNWKAVADEAPADGSSSSRNIQAFTN